MSRQVTSFALALILFFAAIAVVSVEATDGCKRKRDYSPLVERTDKKQCPCALAQATFDKTVCGISVFAQNELGQTTITGYLTGLVDPHKNQYAFLIESCGKIIANLTNVLNATISEAGVAKFTALDKDLNLNCNANGILNLVCNSTTTTTKPYSSYKRQNGSNMQINQNGGSYARAPIGGI